MGSCDVVLVKSPDQEASVFRAGVCALALVHCQPVSVRQVSPGEAGPLPGRAVSIPEEANDSSARVESPGAGSAARVH